MISRRTLLAGIVSLPFGKRSPREVLLRRRRRRTIVYQWTTLPEIHIVRHDLAGRREIVVTL